MLSNEHIQCIHLPISLYLHRRYKSDLNQILPDLNLNSTDFLSCKPSDLPIFPCLAIQKASISGYLAKTNPLWYGGYITVLLSIC